MHSRISNLEYRSITRRLKSGVEVLSTKWRGSVSVSIMTAGVKSFNLCGAVSLVTLETSLHGKGVAGKKGKC